MEKAVKARQPRRVLIVEDHPDLSDLFFHQVTVCGHEARTATNGQSAIALTQEFKPDLVLLDLVLPVMNGYEIARVLRQNGFRKKIVALTAMSFPQKSSDIDEFIIKPVFSGVIEALCDDIDVRGIRGPIHEKDPHR
jgi:CheY-like chemotaxis protein